MNVEIEREIINCFFKKNKQERMIWELENPEKRKYFWNRIAHLTVLEESCLQVSEYKNYEELQQFLMEKSGRKEIYMIGESYIGEIAIEDAIDYLQKSEICILYCGNGIGYYQPEEDYGNFKKYILISPKGRGDK